VELTMVFQKFSEAFANLSRVTPSAVVDVDVKVKQKRSDESGGDFTKQTHLATRCAAREAIC
jgi:hypothetical protein